MNASPPHGRSSFAEAVPPPSLLGLAELAAHLMAGGPALFPTDTLPALAASPEEASCLWRLKQRPATKPLILMGADLDQLRRTLAVPWPEEWLEQAQRSWPGAVTLVLPITGSLAEALNPGGASLGLRVPDCPRAQELLAVTGPLATTSANRSGDPPSRTAVEAAGQFPGLPLLGPLPWLPGSGQASTVMAWEPSGRWRILRPGPVPVAGEEVR